MKTSTHGIRILLLFALVAAWAARLDAKDEMSRTANTVARMLENEHFRQQPLDDTVSLQLLSAYIDALDYNRFFFVQSDIDEFQRLYGRSLDDDIKRGDLDAAYTIFGRYKQRVAERTAATEDLVADPNLIDPTHSVEISREDSPWPRDEAEAQRLWRDRVAADLLQERLKLETLDNETAEEGAAAAESTDDAPRSLFDKTPEELVISRSERLLKSVEDKGRADQATDFLSALAMVYDPHSEYLSQRELKNFEINMALELVGIGALLDADGAYARVQDLVPGGPAERDGRLKPKDRIAAVAQGQNDFLDTVDMPLDEVVDLIRGKKGTTVRLLVLPGTATDPSERQIVEIVRDEVQLKDAEASAQIIEHTGEDGEVLRLGWLTLPSFYADISQSRSSDSASATGDVRRLLRRLQQEKIAGLVVDLSRNGGGSLDEAVDLTGLFIRKGPVVQTKFSNGAIKPTYDGDARIVYDGPLVVLTSRFSASASEIFAAALQDYGRAVVVGDESTFGKGTVQTIFRLDNAIPFLGLSSGNEGALRFTIQKFYRIAGGSTQFRGVLSDIVLPSTTDYNEVGESSLDHALPYDEVDPMAYDRVAEIAPIVRRLALRSAERVAANSEFQYIKQDMQRFRERMDANRISLDMEQRLAELRADDAREKQRTEERASRETPADTVYKLTLDNVEEEKLSEYVRASLKSDGPEPPDNTATDDKNDNGGYYTRFERPRIDPIKDETLLILRDLIAADGNERLAKTP